MSDVRTAHPALAAGRWRELGLMAQLANIGSEVGRAATAKQRGKFERMWGALDRALELFELTVGDPANRGRLREVTRARELVLDYLVGDNVYKSSAESWDEYFVPFAVAARRGRELA